MSMNDFTAEIAKKLAEIKKSSNGWVSFEDVSKVVVMVIETMNKNFTEGSVIFKELEEMKGSIEKAKGEAVTILHNEDSTIPDASAHLDDVMKSTENAANTIIDAASSIMELAGDNEKVMAHAMKIIESCDFGDLSRQRLKKVFSHLQNIEARLDRIFKELKIERKAATERKVDGVSLSGPQLSGLAPTQADIDALFGNS